MDYWDPEYVERKLIWPATGLIVTSLVCCVLLLVTLAFDAWLLFSGSVAEGSRASASESQIVIRSVWSLLILANNIVILVGAMQMKGVRNWGASKRACILALIPCLGPCFVLGIPFGIWGLVALNDPLVREAFNKDNAL